jgi:hypothetical protein
MIIWQLKLSLKFITSWRGQGLKRVSIAWIKLCIPIRYQHPHPTPLQKSDLVSLIHNRYPCPALEKNKVLDVQDVKIILKWPSSALSWFQEPDYSKRHQSTIPKGKTWNAGYQYNMTSTYLILFSWDTN